MSIPYFSREDNLTAFRKMKILFLIRKIRFIDFCILFTWIMPFVLNMVVFNLLKGGNEIKKVIFPFGSAFNSSSAELSAEWTSWYGAIHICALILTVVSRIVLSRNLWRRMKQYQNEQPKFKWNPKNKFWLVVCLPFVSFVIYPILLKIAQFELVHKYNL